MTTEEEPRSPTTAELFTMHSESIGRELNVSRPGRIDKYDPKTQKADVKPLVMDLTATRDGTELLEELPVIPSVPVMFLRGGGFFVSVPIAKGDLVTLLFSDRSLDNYLSGRGVVTDPDDFRTHALADAVAIPGGYPFALGIDESGVGDHMVLGKEGGAQIHIKPDAVHLYEENAADFVALAQKVLDELEAAKADRVAMKGKFDDHIHITTATISAGSAGVIAKTTTPFSTQTDPSSVAAEKVHAT